MKRGEVYWLKENIPELSGSEIQKKRPWVVVGANPLNKGRKTVLVVPLSRSAKVSAPVVIEVFALGQSVGAVCDQLRAANKNRFIVPAAMSLSHTDMQSIDDALREILCL